jgi:hypothetical protein
MPSIDKSFLLTLKEDYTEYPNFIETGTCYGETIFEMEKHFTNLYTIEIKPEFYYHLVNKYKGNKIKFFLGDSSNVLPNILPYIDGKSIFFLDGHWSACNTGKGDKDCPLYEELNAIMSHYNNEAILIIDDVRLFGSGPNVNDEICNWEDISINNVLSIVSSRMSSHYFLPSYLHPNDRLIINLNHK